MKKVKGEYVLTDISYSGMTSLQDRMIRQLRVLSTDVGWLERTENQSLGKVLFKNGIHIGEEFLDKETHGFDPSIRFTSRIDHDYLSDPSDEDIIYGESVRQRLFSNPMNDLEAEKFLKSAIGRALLGDAKKMKQVLFGISDSNCGKSTLTAAIKKALGDLCGTFGASCFAVQRQRNNDQAQQWRWSYELRHCRIIISNEIDVSSKIDGHMLKIAV